MRAPYRRRPATLLAVAATMAVALLAGCSSGSEEAEEPTGPVIDGRDVSADDIVWQAFGGSTDFSPAASAQAVPDLTIYADGRAFVADPTTTGPRTMTQGSIAADDLATFIATAQDSGVLEPGVDFGATDRTDLPLTTVVLADGTIPLTAAVVGLSADDLDLTGAQQQARDDLAALVAESNRLVADAEPWTPDRVRAVSIGPDAGPEIDAPNAQPWPGPAFAEFPEPDAFSGTACLLLGEPEAATIWAAALDNPTGTWSEQDELRQIVVAPVLPGEEGCPHGADDDHGDDDHGDDEGDGDGEAGDPVTTEN